MFIEECGIVPHVFTIIDITVHDILKYLFLGNVLIILKFA